MTAARLAHLCRVALAAALCGDLCAAVTTNVHVAVLPNRRVDTHYAGDGEGASSVVRELRLSCGGVWAPRVNHPVFCSVALLDGCADVSDTGAASQANASALATHVRLATQPMLDVPTSAVVGVGAAAAPSFRFHFTPPQAGLYEVRLNYTADELLAVAAVSAHVLVSQSAQGCAPFPDVTATRLTTWPGTAAVATATAYHPSTGSGGDAPDLPASLFRDRLADAANAAPGHPPPMPSHPSPHTVCQVFDRQS